MDVAKVTEHMCIIRKAYKYMQYNDCLREIASAKKHFEHFLTFFNCDYLTSENSHEAHLVRDAYEHECLCYARLGDENGFQASYNSLRYYYNGSLEKSEKEILLSGIYLLTLLIKNRSDLFNAELELFTDTERLSIYISPIVELERFLADGNYTKVIEARSTVPTNDYEMFFKKLIERLTHIIADNISASCDSIPSDIARSLISFKGQVEVNEDIARALCSIDRSSIRSKDSHRDMPSHEDILRCARDFAISRK